MKTINTYFEWLVSIIVMGGLLLLSGCGGQPSLPTPLRKVEVDLSTPESVVESIEEAYRAKDMKAVLQCKDFDAEARLMMDRLEMGEALKGDKEILTQLSETLELGFQAEIKQTGFPNFDGAVSTLSGKKPYQGRDDVVQMTESLKFPNGKTVTNKVYAAKSDAGWKFVMISDDE